MMEWLSVGRGLAMGDGDSVSIAVQLEKLEALRSSGSLSDAEFQKLKSALVAQSAPRTGGTGAWLIGALAAVVVVIALVLFAMPRHTAGSGTQTAAQPALKSESAPSPVDRAANDAAAPPPAPAAGPPPAAATEPPPTYPTSFDCNQAQRLALRLICTNPSLAAQDLQLATLYRRARANAIDPSQLSDQQQQWLAARDSCASIGCLATVYAARRRELAQWITN